MNLHTSEIIRTENLCKVYRFEDIETLSLDRLSLTIKEGEFIAIMGPSGCGKTTLLNILGMLDKPSSGEYYFSESNTGDLSERQKAVLRKENIGFVFQNFNLIDELTVFENIELPLLYSRMGRSERKSRVMEVIRNLGIHNRHKHYPRQLSGGQQQRAAVARAIVSKPKLILADEPTGNLDSKNGEEVMQLLCDMHSNGTGIIMVTHSPEHARFANRIIHLLDGKITRIENREARAYV